jgi:hypothetical protein
VVSLSSTEPTSDQLNALVVKQAIRDVLFKYCRGVDRCHVGTIASAFHSDAYSGPYNLRGNRAIAEAIVAQVTDHALSCSHFIGNILIELKGEFAWVETYFIAYHQIILDGNEFTRTRQGRYLDLFERREQRWGISERASVTDWSRLDVVEREAPDSETWIRGERGLSDPVFARRPIEFGPWVP